jgi:hypothetical protein
MRFIPITVVVAIAHIAISGLLFCVGFGGLVSTTASETANAQRGYTFLSAWNFGPIAANQYLADHVYSPAKTVFNTSNRTQGDQIVLNKEVQFQSDVGNFLFLIWPFIVGSVVASVDVLFRFAQKKRSKPLALEQ